MPANLLIYKSIWQGTINSFSTVGCAEGGVPSPGEGRRVPPSAPALLNPKTSVPSTRPSPISLPGSSHRDEQPNPPQSQTPFSYTNSSQPPKHDLQGKII